MPTSVRPFGSLPAQRFVGAALGQHRPVEVLAPGALRTARMLLRPLRETDRPEFLRVLTVSRDHLRPYSALHREGESDDQLFDRQLELCRVGDDRCNAWRRVAILDDGRIAGCFNLNSISRGLTFEADANWWVSGDCARMGLGTEGVQAMIDYAFADLPRGLGLHQVHAAIMPSNTMSISLARKVGLTRQPTSKVSIRIADKWEFHDIYSRSVLDAAQATASIAC